MFLLSFSFVGLFLRLLRERAFWTLKKEEKTLFFKVLVFVFVFVFVFHFFIIFEQNKREEEEEEARELRDESSKRKKALVARDRRSLFLFR